ncbi:MAG: glycosyl transferase family 1 [Arthrobacter sp.]|nr:glycosyl transferase family 1 [Arthrobacter sp.]
MQASGLRLRLVVPGNVRHNSGGNVYNAALARELGALGADVDTCAVDGGWPVGSAEDRRRLDAVLGAPGVAGRDEGAKSRSLDLVDGLLACGAPDQLEAAAAAGRAVWILLHMPLVTHPALEKRALQAAAGVICTSASAAAELRTRHGLDGIRVALPGSDPAPLAGGSEPPHLIAVAALLPNKDQALLLAALSELTELPWTASLIGSDSADPAYAARLRDTVERLGLRNRVKVPGELRGAALEAEWAAADLSLLVSRAEAYGLVVTESLARGIPVAVRAGTGAVEALRAGARPERPAGKSPPAARTPAARTPGEGTAPDSSPQDRLPGIAVALAADPAPLADVLRRWLTDASLRAGWRAAARAARDRLPGWDTTARMVLTAVGAELSQKKPHASDSSAGQAVGE